MDKDSLVEEAKDEGAAILRDLQAANFSVDGGFWIKASEDGQWYFYVISPEANDEKLAEAYRRLHAAVRQMEHVMWIDPLEIKLIGPDSQLAKAVFDIHRKYPGRLAMVYGQGGRNLGGLSIDMAYFYP